MLKNGQFKLFRAGRPEHAPAAGRPAGKYKNAPARARRPRGHSLIHRSRIRGGQIDLRLDLCAPYLRGVCGTRTRAVRPVADPATGIPHLQPAGSRGDRPAGRAEGSSPRTHALASWSSPRRAGAIPPPTVPSCSATSGSLSRPSALTLAAPALRRGPSEARA